MIEYTIITESQPNEEDNQAVLDGLIAYNIEKAGPSDNRPISVFIRDNEHRVAGGLVGRTHWGWLHINYFWLQESFRRKGIGEKIIKTAETEARARGCRSVLLDTYSFQARGFYEKLGYKIFGTLDNYPHGHQRFFMKKNL